MLSYSAGHEPAAAVPRVLHLRAGQRRLQLHAKSPQRVQAAPASVSIQQTHSHILNQLACSSLQFRTAFTPAWLLCPTAGPASTAGACPWDHPASPSGGASWPQCQQPPPRWHLCWGCQGRDSAWLQTPSPQHRGQPLAQGWGLAALRVGLQRLEAWPLGWLACQCCPGSYQQGMAQVQCLQVQSLQGYE